ncbi:MAG: FecR family protein [Bacteroidales bacterium]|nr:FecR family protein [Bacteroidales bacterium]
MLIDLTEMITPMGAKSQCILPDGTKVWLNAGSRLTYKKSFNEKERVVNLTGEAFFQVKTNKEKPFIVQTSKLSVKALGTTFNVKAYAEDKQVTATLVEGIILVEGKGADSKSFSVKLKPRQSITLKESEIIDKQKLTEQKSPENSKSIEIAPSVEVQEVINTVKYTSWKDSLWQIEAENLEDLAIMISRRFNVKIYNESAGLKDYRFTGTIRNETLEQVLNILRYTTPLKYKVGKGEVWWTLDSRLKEDYSKVLKSKH